VNGNFFQARFVAALSLASLGALSPWLPFVRAAEERTIDARFQLRGRLPERARVFVVAVDDKTERAWRDIPKAMWAGQLAKVVTRLDADGAKRVALDFVVSADPDNYLSSKGVDETPNADLERAVFESEGRTLLGTSRAGDVAPPLDVPKWLVSVNRVPAQGSGVVRQAPRYDTSFSPPLRGLAAALADEPRGRLEPIDLNYSDRSPIIVSALDVIEGRTPRGLFRDAIVVLGETDTGSGDLHATPFSSSVPGVLVQAEATRTLLDGDELRVLPTWVASLVSALVGLLGSLLAFQVWLKRYFCITGVASVAWSLACYGAFARFNALWPWLVPVSMALIAAPGVVYALRAVEENRERLWARSVWGQLIGDSSLRRLEENRKSGRGAWGEFECCVLFFDVAGFSSLTVRLNEQRAELVLILNTLFSPVIGCVERHGGEVLNFMGDGFMAKWETVPGADGSCSRTKAVEASIDILRLVREQNVRGAFGSERIEVRMGLSAGQVTLALVGSEGRKQMTVHGEAVNLAARLEAAGKEIAIQSSLVLSDDYAETIKELDLSFEEAEYIPKGWDKPLRIWYLSPESRLGPLDKIS